MTRKKKKSLRKIVILLIIVGSLIGLGLAAFLKKKEVVLSVETEKVGRRDITEVVLADGRIHPVIQVKISPEVSGEIIALPVKEGQKVRKGDLLLRIKPELYEANVRRVRASYDQSVAGLEVSRAELQKSILEFNRVKSMYDTDVVSEAEFESARTSRDVAQARVSQSEHQVSMAQASLESAQEDLAKTIIHAPLDGTISRLNSELGERVLGTAQNMGTEIMIISDLNEMEARVEIGEIDIVLIKTNLIAKLEVDAFKDREFTGVVTEIGNTAISTGAGSQQQATKFEVKIKINEKEEFRPGMSITADVETRYRTHVIAVPIQCVTRRKLEPVKSKEDSREREVGSTNAPAPPDRTVEVTESDDKSDKKADKKNKPHEVVFVVVDGKAKATPVERGISDDEYIEITEGLQVGDLVVTGSYKAIDRDLKEGSRVREKSGSKSDSDSEGEEKEK